MVSLILINKQKLNQEKNTILLFAFFENELNWKMRRMNGNPFIHSVLVGVVMVTVMEAVEVSAGLAVCGSAEAAWAMGNWMLLE